jgi:citrate synthase
MTIKTDIGYATLHDIFVRGRNLSNDIIPNADFTDMVCLCILGTTPTPNFKRMVNVLMVTSADHGFTPSSMCARLLGAGDRYLGVRPECCSEKARDWRPMRRKPTSTPGHARCWPATKRRKKRIHGVGHLIHTDGDPRVASLRALSQETGYYGTGWRLLDALETVHASEGRKLPINGAGAMGAIAADLKLAPKIARGLALVGRTAGLVAHLVEESRTPVAAEMWDLVLEHEAKPEQA